MKSEPEINKQKSTTDTIKILYISYDGMTDNLGQSQVIPYLEGLSEKGYHITILSCEKPGAYEQRREHISNILSESSIAWNPIPYTAQPKVISTIKDVQNLRRTARKLHKKEGFSIVHCRSYIAALIGLGMKRRHLIKFIFDMRGFWADERVEGGIWSKKSLFTYILYYYFKRKEIEYFSNADYTISLTHAGEKEIHSWNVIKNQPIPIKVIPCCSDFKLFTKENVLLGKDEVKEKLGIPGHNAVLSYLGSLGTWYMRDEMLDFFKLYLEKKKNATFLFITGDNPQEIIDAAHARGIAKENLTILRANREDVPEYLSVSDLSVFFIKPVFSKTASSPTKMGEIMGLGIPLVCNTKVGDVEQIVNDSACGFLVNDFTEAAYKKVLDQLDTKEFNTEAIVLAGRDFYSLEKGIERYDEVYKTLLE